VSTTTKKQSPYSADEEQSLMTELWDPQVSENLVNFVKFAFPWGKAGTPLEGHKEPRKWQIKELEDITEHIAHCKYLIAQGKSPQVYKSATASGRGIGKSALVSWLNFWTMTCNLGASAITTANTEQQLKSRTWAELGKWHTLAINSHWFDRSALSLRPQQWFEDALKTQLKIDTGYYYAQAQLWSEDNPDAFAGVHNMNGVTLVYDEGSGIPESIWSVSEGFFTEPVLHRYWFCFSNPRRNTGAFFECFHKHRSFWKTKNIDSRTVEGTDKAVYESIIRKYGEDSDEARIEVKGEFPRQGDNQFIGRDVVQAAQERELFTDEHAGLIMGVDPARFGADSTVIFFRRGRDARSMPPIELKGKDNMQVANICADWINKLNPDAVCIDAGNGTGVIDRLREMGFKVHEVWFGSSAESEEWANKRTEMWGRMREWLGGGCLPDLRQLGDDLVGPEYKFRGTSDKLMLEPKEQMKKRGLSSPDFADALACTFSIKVARKDRSASRGAKRQRIASGVDYDPFGG